MFADDLILYIENHEDATRKLLELTNEFGKVAEDKIKSQNLLHSYIQTMKHQKKKSRGKFHLAFHKKEKIPRNKPT